ncbi:MAG: enoyl-CoA hydratase/isomerase family protein [Gammaproteobacteria bacterium]|nr:enoyl-CoA hydratase/isomerase family protein [Gammaproteobacteria bacterium]
MAVVEVVGRDGWAELVLNRPERRNAIDGELGVALADCLVDLSTDADVRCILLRGAGGAFCSGLDLKAFNADPEPEWLPRFGAIWRRAHKALFECSKPVVAALERYGINGGAAVALAADLLIAGEGAFIQVGEVQQGLAAPYNMAWLRLRHGEAVAARLTLTGRRFFGPELAQLGVAYSCVPDDEVVAETERLVEQLAAYPDGSLARIKATMRAYNDADADAWFDRATTAGAGRGPGRLRSVDPRAGE